MKKLEGVEVTDFSDYWKSHGDLYKQLSVSKEAAYKIWCDCADAIYRVLAELDAKGKFK